MFIVALCTEIYGFQALHQILTSQIRIQTFPQIHERAWQLATQFKRPTAYDAYYLSLAEYLECEFWTGDERLYNAVRDELPWVKWLRHFST